MYVDWNGREQEDLEGDNMRRDAAETPGPAFLISPCEEQEQHGGDCWNVEKSGGDVVNSHITYAAAYKQVYGVEPPEFNPFIDEDTSTFYEVYRLPWPLSDSELVQEFVYHVDAAGQVVPGKWNEEQRAALQALVNHRGPEARKPGRGNSLEEISADSPEARLSLALALAMLSPEERQAYHARQEQEKRIEYARGLVRAAHQPVCFDAGFSMGPIEEQDDGTGLVEVSDTGPNWTNRYTLYVLALAPEIEILQAYTPFGEHCFNHHFQLTEKSPDDSGMFDDFPATLARIWRGTDWLT